MSTLEIRRCGRLACIGVHMRARRLDRALAAGESPDSRSDLSLQAERLLRTSTRRRLARDLRAVVRAAVRPHAPLDLPGAAVPGDDPGAAREDR